jgi:hypothetical protein
MDACPLEILQNICGHIARPTDLANLACCNRTLYKRITAMRPTTQSYELHKATIKLFCRDGAHCEGDEHVMFTQLILRKRENIIKLDKSYTWILKHFDVTVVVTSLEGLDVYKKHLRQLLHFHWLRYSALKLDLENGIKPALSSSAHVIRLLPTYSPFHAADPHGHSANNTRVLKFLKLLKNHTSTPYFSLLAARGNGPDLWKLCGNTPVIDVKDKFLFHSFMRSAIMRNIVALDIEGWTREPVGRVSMPKLRILKLRFNSDIRHDQHIDAPELEIASLTILYPAWISSSESSLFQDILAQTSKSLTVMYTGVTVPNNGIPTAPIISFTQVNPSLEFLCLKGICATDFHKMPHQNLTVLLLSLYSASNGPRTISMWEGRQTFPPNIQVMDVKILTEHVVRMETPPQMPESMTHLHLTCNPGKDGMLPCVTTPPKFIRDVWLSGVNERCYCLTLRNTRAENLFLSRMDLCMTHITARCSLYLFKCQTILGRYHWRINVMPRCEVVFNDCAFWPNDDPTQQCTVASFLHPSAKVSFHGTAHRVNCRVYGIGQAPLDKCSLNIAYPELENQMEPVHTLVVGKQRNGTRFTDRMQDLTCVNAWRNTHLISKFLNTATIDKSIHRTTNSNQPRVNRRRAALYCYDATHVVFDTAFTQTTPHDKFVVTEHPNQTISIKGNYPSKNQISVNAN